MNSNSGEIVIYQTLDGQTKIDVKMENETVWLTQLQMAELFQTSKQNISLHISNAFKEGELVENAVVKDSLTTAADGKNYQTKFYNLDVIISVGYRVKSLRGTQFRRWALELLREYLIKGFTMNDAFFKIVQNKIHYAAHGHTAAEIVFARANAEQPFMGLTSFKGDQPTKSEIDNAKNYLDETELGTLNRMVSAFFDLAELRAMNHQPMYMKDWIVEVDDFAGRYGQGALTGAGSISHQQALAKATAEYDKYRKKIALEPSPAEIDFLDGIKKAQKQLQKGEKKKGGGSDV